MKILHIADCHLDSAMESHLPARTAKSRRRELLLTFSDVMEGARSEGVSLVLIAGDLFDTEVPSASAVRYVLDCIASHADMTFLYIEGNHDAGALAAYELPDNLHRIPKGTAEVFRFGDVCVYAAGYATPGSVIEAFTPQKEKKNIFLLHGTLSTSRSDTREEIIPHALFRGKPVDYLALGHFHSYTPMRLEDGGLACYAGTPEGRGFDETGKCGVILFDSDTLCASFVPTARRLIHDVRVDVSGAETLNEIERRVREAIAEIRKEDMVTLTLVGEIEDVHLKQPEQIRLLLDGKFFFSKLKDATRLRLRPEGYENDVSLRGEFVRRVMQNEALSEEDKQRVLTFGLRALEGEMPEEVIYESREGGRR
ncbi:MAG: metallophosphoesterase [Clostridia bacterium]|nr:metallophosphoesterase [Clostridia bacterium]